MYQERVRQLQPHMHMAVLSLGTTCNHQLSTAWVLQGPHHMLDLSGVAWTS